jgi:hypothetical protein
MLRRLAPRIEGSKKTRFLSPSVALRWERERVRERCATLQRCSSPHRHVGELIFSRFCGCVGLDNFVRSSYYKVSLLSFSSGFIWCRKFGVVSKTFGLFLETFLRLCCYLIGLLSVCLSIFLSLSRSCVSTTPMCPNVDFLKINLAQTRMQYLGLR